MPKRPSSVAITADNTTIISADKFGDVYALPLVSSDGPPPAAETQTALLASKPRRLEANQFTVHSKRNLVALEHQQRQQQKQQQQGSRPSSSSDPPRPFEHTLLLGHVSMLTAVAVGSHGCRSYILTADRDEHVRVSRGVPQAHVVEAFCLGHRAFVSRLCIAPQRPAVLVSAGGDDDLFVWHWPDGRLLSTAPLLEHVRRVAGPGTAAAAATASRVAVSGLFSYSSPAGRQGRAAPGLYFGVICERLVPAPYVY